MGFYFAWQIHYTGWLIPPMIVGVVITFIMVIMNVINEDHYTEYLYSHWAFIYGLFMMIWVTFFNQSWIRRQNSIANMWLVRDFKDSTTQSSTFKAEYAVDPDSKHKIKVALKSAYKTQIFVGGSISLLFVSLVILSQIVLQKLNYDSL